MESSVVHLAHDIKEKRVRVEMQCLQENTHTLAKCASAECDVVLPCGQGTAWPRDTDFGNIPVGENNCKHTNSLVNEIAHPILSSVDFEEGDGVLAVDLIAWWMKQHTLLLCSSARVNENSNKDKVPEMRTLWRLKVNSESAQARQNSHKYTIGTLVSTCVEQRV